VRLLSHPQDYLVLYQLGDHQDYHHGYMVPSTGYLRWFDLVPTNGGSPCSSAPPRTHPVIQHAELPKAADHLRKYGSWLERLGISNVGA
jgi:uridine kinase